MFKERAVTALLMSFTFLVSLFLLPWWVFAAFIATVICCCAWEWANLSGWNVYRHRVIYFLSVILASGVAAYFLGLFGHNVDIDIFSTLLLMTCLWWALALLWVQGYPASAVLWGSTWVRLLMGYWLLIPSLLALIYLHKLEHGPWLILLLVVHCAFG